MANFIGAECLICKGKFTENDDIVVCPECGTPYHRECYAKEGRCINDELHEEKISWSEKKEQAEKGKPIICEKCGAENKSHSFLCQQCGASLVDNLNFEDADNNNEKQAHYTNAFPFNMNDKYCGMNPEEEIAEDVKISEAADFIGTNVPYYLSLFKRMKDSGKKISICIIALLFPQLYFGHRKMWLEAFLMTVLEILLMIPYAVYMVAATAQTYISEYGVEGEIVEKLASINIDSPGLSLAVTLTNYISMALSVLAFLIANYLYYRHMQKKINKIKSRYSSQEEISARIAATGGTSVLGIFAILILQLILSMILVSVLMYIYM